MIKARKSVLRKYFQITGIMILMLLSAPVIGQENPPIPINVEVRTARFLDFGAFTTGNGVGSIRISPDSNPVPNGDVFMIRGRVVTSALFDVYANPGTIVNMVPAQANFQLAGSEGGNLNVTISNEDFSTGPTFITTANSNMPNEVYVGGTLNIGSIESNPSGQYTGTIIINFIQE